MEGSFEEHNEEVRRIWADFEKGDHQRVPVSWSMNYKMLLLDPKLNTNGYIFRQLFERPDVMLKAQLQFEHWRRHNVWSDWEMGLPDRWDIGVNFQNVYESAWLGGALFYAEDQVPDVRPFLNDKDEIADFMSRGTPDPVSGFMTRVREFYDNFIERKEEGFTFKGRPMGEISLPIGTDGPLTIAMNISGGTVLKLLHSDPGLLEKFLWFLTDALIERMKVWHKLKGVGFPYEGFSFADDSIQLLSPRVYRLFVLPLHKEIVRAFCIGRPAIHLCGDVNQHLEALRDELHIRSLDCGYPLDLTRAREKLGDDVLIRGNIHVVTLLNGPKDAIREEALRILNSGVLRGKRFIFAEGNNVAPMTPAENLNYAYEVVRESGKVS